MIKKSTRRFFACASGVDRRRGRGRGRGDAMRWQRRRSGGLTRSQDDDPRRATHYPRILAVLVVRE